MSTRRLPPGALLAGAVGVAFAIACGCGRPEEACDPYSESDCSLTCSYYGFGPYAGGDYDDEYVFVGDFGDGRSEGTARSPFAHIGPAIHAAGKRGVGTVLVAPGTYVEQIELDERDAGVVVVPVCAVPGTVSIKGKPQMPIVRLDGDADTEVGFGSLEISASDGAGVEVTGGKLALVDVSLSGTAGVGLLATGPEATLVVEEVTIDGVSADSAGNGFGVVLSEGARLEGRGLTVAGAAHSALVAQGEGTSLELHEVMLSGLGSSQQPPTPEQEEAGVKGSAGILLMDGVRAVLTDATVSQVWGVGLQLEASRAVLQRVEIDEVRPTDSGWGDGALVGSGVMVLGSSALVASELSIAGASEFGLVADGASSVEIDGGTIRYTYGATDDPGSGIGLLALTGSIAEANGLVLQGNQVFGAAAAGLASELRLTDVDILDTEPSVDSALGGGLLVDQGAVATVTRTTIDGSVGFGILAAGSQLALTDVEIHDTLRSSANSMAVGLLADAGADVQIEGLQIRRTQGTGLAAWSAMLTCTDCTLTGNAFAGLAAVGSHVEVTGAHVAGTAPDATTGGGYGIFADSRSYPGALILRSSTVEDHPLAAVYLAGSGVFTLEGNTLAGGPVDRLLWPTGTAVFAAGTAAGPFGAQLIHNTIRDSQGGGLFLDGGTASLQGNTWSGNATDLVQQLCDGVPPPQGLEEELIGTIQLCPIYDQPVELLEFSLNYETLVIE